MSKDALRLLHITDPHLHAHADGRMRGLNTYDTFQSVIADAMDGQLAPDAVIATGDLVQDETRAGYERFRQTLEPHGVPVYCIPGNHDAPNIMNDVLGSPPFQVGGTAKLQDWTIILLNSFSQGDDGGQLNTAELLRLSSALANQSAGHVLICIHHHPVPMGSRWLDGVALRNANDFFAVVDQCKRVRAVLWGHVHQASDTMRRGVRLLSSPSTCSQFLPNHDDFALDTRPPGYRWLLLYPDGTIDTSVIWLE